MQALRSHLHSTLLPGFLALANGRWFLEARSALGAVHGLSIIPLPAVFAVYHLSYKLQSVYRFLGQVAQTHHLITRLRVNILAVKKGVPLTIMVGIIWRNCENSRPRNRSLGTSLAIWPCFASTSRKVVT